MVHCVKAFTHFFVILLLILMIKIVYLVVNGFDEYAIFGIIPNNSYFFMCVRVF